MKLFWVLCVPLVAARVIREQVQEPSVEAGTGEPAIGIHFTTSYATAAVKYANGAVEDLVRVEAEAEYIELMAQWSDHQNKRKCRTAEEMLLCDLQRTARQTNTGNTGILSAFIQKVKFAIEEELGTTITEILPVFPPLDAIDIEDVEEAFAHAGLTHSLLNNLQSRALLETNAAYAGLGYGKCKSVAESLPCIEEEKEAYQESVLFLNFDNSSFSATLQSMSAPSHNQRVSASSLDPTLGWWSLPVYEMFQAAREVHWARIEAIIFDVVSSASRRPSRIILMGEHAQEEEFVEVVKAALWNNFEWEVDQLLEANADVDSATVAARGAAELAFQNGIRSKTTHAPSIGESIELK